MNTPEGSVWFVGDLDDPWVAAIADALPDAVRKSCPGGLPESLFDVAQPPTTVVLHRAILTPRDAERLARLKGARKPSPRVVLCVGPHVRHADLERWATLVDAVVPEATARDTIARHVGDDEESKRPPSARPRVSVVSANFELRQTLADACAWAGYAAEPLAGWSEARGDGLAIWDVPVLEADWPNVLARRARSLTVIALLGFADRATVGQARANGAAACLDLPFDLADLVCVLDRLATQAARGQPAHAVPPPPAVLRHSGLAVAETGRDAYN